MAENQPNEFVRGWPILLAAFVGMAVNLASMVYYSSGIWVRPWQDEFGWSRAEIGAQQTISVVTMMLLAPFAGRLIDRYGLRPVTTISLLGFGILLLGFPLMNGSLWMFYSLSVAYAVFGVASTALAFTRAVNAFFIKYRGLALGISLTSTGVMAYLMPRFMTPFVAENGWRAGYVIMFLVVMAALPIVFLFIRDAPEKTPATSDMPDTPLPPTQSGITLREAVSHATFWKMAAIFFLVSLAILGLIPAFIPLLQDAGLSAGEAGSIGALMGLSVMTGRLLVGFLLDHIFAPYLTALVFGLLALGCLALGLGGISFATITAIALGLAVGAEVDLIGYYTARYFGLAHYGTIYGVQYAIFIFGAGVSPIYTGFIWDTTGNYDIALFIAAALMVPVIALALSLPRFTDKPES